MRAVITPDDLKKGDLAEPGWHPTQIIRYEEKPAGENAKSPGSTNCIWTFKIIDGPSKGIETSNLINETAWGFGKNFFAAMAFPKNAAGGYDVDTQLFERTVGHKIDIYIERGKSDKGTPFNKVVDFRQAS